VFHTREFTFWKNTCSETPDLTIVVWMTLTPLHSWLQAAIPASSVGSPPMATLVNQPTRPFGQTGEHCGLGGAANLKDPASRDVVLAAIYDWLRVPPPATHGEVTMPSERRRMLSISRRN
jgi:hypothetical protein